MTSDYYSQKPTRPDHKGKDMGASNGRPAQQTNRVIPLEALIKRDRKLIIESSVIVDGSLEAFIARNTHALEEWGQCLLVPQFELGALSDSQRQRIEPLLGNRMIQPLQCDGADEYQSLLPGIRSMSKEKGHLCFLVNDYRKSGLIISAAKSARVFVQLFRISPDGSLVQAAPKNNGGETQRQRGDREGRSERASTASRLQGSFHITTTPERMRVAPIRIPRAPVVGSVLYDSRGNPISLVEQEMVNPNAITYSTNVAGTWAKVYNSESLNTFLEEKAKRMLSREVRYEGLCWPTDVLRDQNGNFVGVLVPPAKGEPLQLAVFKQAKLQAYFPEWDKKDLCDLAVTILRKIQYLHKVNVLMGCINPAAIRIAGKDEVYFVDTDNYQVEGFPTIVYNTTFTPPELLGKGMYLCTKENENYAVAMLVFMLMMPGKIPYTIGQDQSVEQAIQERQFPFPCGDFHGSHANPSMWRFMWSHLTPLKDPFFNTFQRGGRYESPENRRTVGNWIGTVLRFRDELEHPIDPESLKIYPRTFKRGRNVEFFTCRFCGTDHPRFYFNARYFDSYRICNSCIDKRSDVSFTCRACGRTFYYTNRTALFHAMKKRTDSSWRDQKYCRDCKNKTMRCVDCGEEYPYYYLRNGRCRSCGERRQNAPYETRVCRGCGKSFTITNGEHEYFLQRGWSDPVRCKACRKK